MLIVGKGRLRRSVWRIINDPLESLRNLFALLGVVSELKTDRLQRISDSLRVFLYMEETRRNCGNQHNENDEADDAETFHLREVLAQRSARDKLPAASGSYNDKRALKDGRFYTLPLFRPARP
jgi:hypothetical protein